MLLILPLRILLTTSANGLDIFKYEAPVVTVQQGSGWIINGHLNLVHTINLESFAHVLAELNNLLESHVSNKQRRAVIEFHLQQATERLDELKSRKPKSKRSIDWLGSAWKWIAGSPDAADWDSILRSENKIIENNNQQYKVNERLFNVSLEATKRINQMIARFNNIDKESDSSSIEHDVLNRALIVKEEVNEIIRACQMARNGIVNSNLLDREEVNHLLAEIETLPYGNVVEAIEYAKPSIFSNGTILLYILAIPKVGNEEFRLLLARAASLHGKRVKLEHQKLLVSETLTYGITGSCYSINNATICEMSSVRKLPEDGCVARLLKGGDAKCSYEPHEGETVELIDENTIFVTNFAGSLQGGSQTRSLNGTYLIQIKNEVVYVGDKVFSSKMAKSSQALPPVLSNVTMENFKPNLEYIHGLNIENISRLSKLGQEFKISAAVEAIVFSIIILAFFLMWKKVTADIQLPKIQPCQGPALEGSRTPPFTHINLRDADI